MTFDLREILASSRGRARELHERHVNPMLANVLDLIGFQHEYVGGEGAYLTALNGERYFDALSGYGVFAMGRNHPVVREAVRQAMDANLPSLAQMDCFALSGLLAEKLLSTAPANLGHVFFTNSGTEAVEGAVKFARAATGRPRFLYQPGAFHGLTTGSLSLNGDASFRDGFGELLPGAAKVDFERLDEVERELSKGDVAAAVLEPIRGKGVKFPSDPGVYPALEALCRKHGTLLIADEIQTGLGRTGKWWAFGHWNLTPDIVTCAKALSGGLVPVGAILYTPEIYKKVYSRLDRCVVHSSTFGQNALAMAAGLAALHVIESEGLVENAARRGGVLLEGMNALRERSEFVLDVRGKGLMVGIEFGPPRSLRLKPAWMLLHTAENGLFAQAVVMQLYKDWKILTQVSGHKQEIVKLIPPLTITAEETARLPEAIGAVLDECRRFPGPVWSVGKQLASAAARQRLWGRQKQPA